MISLDIETVCDVKECPGFGKSDNTCTDPVTGKTLSIGHAVDPWRNRITCIGVWGVNGNYVYRELEEFKRDLDADEIDTFITHGGQFDILTLWTHGLKVPLDKWKYDTRLLAHTFTEKVTDEYLEEYNVHRKELNKKLPPHIEHRLGKKLSLKVLAPFFLNVDPFWEDPSDHDSDEYVLKDCEYTYKLYEHISERMQDRDFEFYETKFMDYAKLLLRATYRGIAIDLEKLEAMAARDISDRYELEARMELNWGEAYNKFKLIQEETLRLRYEEMQTRALERMKKPTHEKRQKVKARYYQLFLDAKEKAAPFSITSSKDRTWLFKEYFKYDITNNKEKESTDAEVAERLIREGHKDLEPYIKWSKINKRLTSYYPNYRRLHVGGIIHPNFDPGGTRTGRLSSSNPNFQNIPPELKCLLIPRPGYKFIEYDASQIEARLIDLYTEDELLHKLIANNISLHSHNAKEFLGLKAEVTPEVDEVKEKYYNERQAVKQFNFSVFYGAGKKMIQGTFFKNGIQMDLKKCAAIRNQMHETYAGAFEYHHEITDFFLKGGVMYNIVGRPVSIARPEDAYMKGFNRLVQGSASDLNLEAARKCQEHWDNKGYDAHVLMLVHDSIRAEVPANNVEPYAEDMKYHMESFKLSNKHGEVKLVAEGGVL